jgi:hypothetical protein
MFSASSMLCSEDSVWQISHPRSPIHQLLRVILLLVLATPVRAADSTLWGQAGELWSPQSRLPDFSFAGYHSGNDPIPTVPVVRNVRDFGAVGNGVADDSQAFIDAIAATSNGAVSIPAGRYRVTRVLRINKPNVVLRGAGSGSTTLFFPTPLNTIMGPAPSWAGLNGNWSWAGGMIWIEGRDNGAQLATITAGALRGAKTLTLNSTTGIAVGQTIRVVQTESDGSLGRHLHADLYSAGSATPNRMVDFATRVTAIAGNTITLERPLRTDVRLGWSPSIYSHIPTVSEVGVEDLTIEFPNTAYSGHLSETGYNGIYLDTVSQCWIRNVTILDPDSGITTASASIGVSRFCTVQNIRLANQWRPTSTYTGHHGIAWEGPQDMLVTNFRFDKMFIHDLTVDQVSCGNVFINGSGLNINFDHHRYAPFENLFSNIDVGSGSTLWTGSRDSDSGNADGGIPSAARETFWNIRGTNLPNTVPSWPQITIVGTTRWPSQNSFATWIEAITPSTLNPVEIYAAQMSRRLAGASSGSACDLDADNATNVTDVQLSVNQAIRVTACSSGDVNRDGSCDVIDVQRIVNAVLSGSCVQS